MYTWEVGHYFIFLRNQAFCITEFSKRRNTIQGLAYTCGVECYDNIRRYQLIHVSYVGHSDFVYIGCAVRYVLQHTNVTINWKYFLYTSENGFSQEDRMNRRNTLSHCSDIGIGLR